jgi:hypothetical protein
MKPTIAAASESTRTGALKDELTDPIPILPREQLFPDNAMEAPVPRRHRLKRVISSLHAGVAGMMPGAARPALSPARQGFSRRRQRRPDPCWRAQKKTWRTAAGAYWVAALSFS